MNSNNNIINRDMLLDMLEEYGVCAVVDNGKITTITLKNPSINFSYAITDGDLKSLHLQDETVEISFEDNSNETFFKIVKGNTMHTATIS